jgi:hypothetical protein
MGIWEKTDKLDTALSLADRFWQLAETLGFKGWIQSVFVLALGVVWTALVRILDHLPFWADSVFGLLLAILSTNFYIRLRKAWSLRGLKSLDIQKMGVECVEFSTAVLEWFIERQDNAPNDGIVLSGNNMDEVRRVNNTTWNARIAYGQQTQIRVVARFAPRLLYLCQLLVNAGLKPPKLWMIDSNFSAIAVHIGAVGELLSKGLLAEARQYHESSWDCHIRLG